MAYCRTSTTVVTPIDRIRQTASDEFDTASIDVRQGGLLAASPSPGPTLGPPVLLPTIHTKYCSYSSTAEWLTVVPAQPS